MKWLFKSFLFATIILAGCAVWLMYTPLPLQQKQILRITPGTGFEQVLDSLNQLQVLGENEAQQQGRRLVSQAYARVTHLATHLQVGEYPIQPGSRLIDVLRDLDKGNVLQHAFTLVDGWNWRQIKAALATAPSLQHKIPTMSRQQLLDALHIKKSRIEGLLAPETYFYTLGSSDLDIVKRALDRRRQTLKSLWSERADDLPYDTPYKALIMASLVEEETAVPAEMPKIAGVFVARLRQGMRLQTDPTVIYALGDDYNGNITLSDLSVPSPYNTYRNAGLPPTPISMPSRLAIKAALHPDVTGNLYFVARGNGTHEFSRTLAEHNAAVREYQLDRRDNYRSTPTAKQLQAKSQEAAK